MSNVSPAVQPANKVQPASPKRSFQELVESDKFKSQLASALPKHLTTDRFTRVLLTATLKNPLLLQCTQESMFKGILDAAAAGVEIDGRRAHLIPYKNNNKQCYEAQLIIDYKGIAELVLRSGVVSSIHADIVCENDEFSYDRGEITVHKVDLKKERGEMYAAYARIVMKDGGVKCEVMSKHEIDAVRRRSRASGNGPWVTDYNEMAKKTVFRRASKWVPLSPEIRGAIESEDISDEPLNVTPNKNALADAIGGIDVPPPSNSEKEAESAESTESAPTQKTFTPEERAAILKEVETAMLDHGVGESKLMLYVHEKKLAKEGQDEVGALDTAVLADLRQIIPTLKKGGAK